MKKISILIVILFGLFQAKAQSVNDALRYSQDDLIGTARFRAMGGAFGALGGDLSSINVNPAGSAIFANSQAGLTFSNSQTKNNANYFGTTRSTNVNDFNINQAGGVFVFDANSDWNKFTFALNLDDNRSFKNNVSFAGTNPNNSIANYFLSYANGIPLNVLNDFRYNDLFYNEQQAYLGYNAFIIDPVINSPNNTAYTSAVLPGRFNQENITTTAGNSGKASFNFAAQYEDNLTVGINLNAHFSELRQTSSFFESNSNNTSTTDNYVKRVRFNNDLYTVGSGFSFNLGAIYKATKELRVGLAFESPTWYNFTDEISQNITATSGTISTELPPDVLIPLQGDKIILEPYTLQTPGKLTGSIAYVFGKRGLISLDISTKDYSSAKFRPKNDFRNTNNAISQNLNSSTEIRLGGEYKIKKVSLRAGYRWEESPFIKNDVTNNINGDLTAYSGGIGYNFGDTKIDLAFSHSKRFTNQSLFSQGFMDAPNVSTINNTIAFTILFDFDSLF